MSTVKNARLRKTVKVPFLEQKKLIGELILKAGQFHAKNIYIEAGTPQHLNWF